MKINSIRFKISVLYLAILCVILVAYSSFLYLGLKHTLYMDLDNELKIKANELQKTIVSYLDLLGDDSEIFRFAVQKAITVKAEYPKQRKIRKIELRWMQRFDKLDLGEDFIQFVNIDGKIVARSNNLSASLTNVFLKDLYKTTEKEGRYQTIKTDDLILRVISLPFNYKDKDVFVIQVGTSQQDVLRQLHNRLSFIILSILVILFFASLLGRLFVAGILKPVEELTQAAKTITYEDLSSRIKIEDVDDEMRSLVLAFNEMMARLEKSFKHIAEFSSHVAHELKTPLAIIRGESELALRKERSPQEYKRVIDVNLSESERMLKTIEDLLLLTRLDYGVAAFPFEVFNFNKFFEEIYEQSKILASPKQIEVQLSLPAESVDIKGNRLHLRRLFYNLIHNAVKFTPPQGQIRLSVLHEDKKVIVEIADNGVGITEEDLPKIFERFFHVDRTGTVNEAGHGLGLSIAQSIARMHHGEIKVKSQSKEGTTFSVILPAI